MSSPSWFSICSPLVVSEVVSDWLSVMSLRVLLSGFTEFGGHSENPSRLLAEQVNSCAGHQADWCGADVRGVVLPVEFTFGFQRLLTEITVFQPDVVLAFGLAVNRKVIEFERFAVNWRETSSMGESAVAGEPISGALIPGAPLALASTLPIERAMSEAKTAGLAVAVSCFAGTYVCNDVFFRMQHHFLRTRIRSGFVHLPPREAGLSIAQLETFVRCLISACR